MIRTLFFKLLALGEEDAEKVKFYCRKQHKYKEFLLVHLFCIMPETTNLVLN